jgi:copper chaperone CopZ
VARTLRGTLPVVGDLVLDVRGMTCEHCRAAVTEAVLTVPGVERVDVDLEAGRVVAGPDPASREAVATAIAKAGYEVD